MRAYPFNFCFGDASVSPGTRRLSSFLIAPTSILFAIGLAGVPAAGAATLAEDFSTDPLERGWKVFGDASLFAWNRSGQELLVTWNSSQPNSYFHHALPDTLTRSDDFSISFDLMLAEVEVGTTPGQPFTFEIAVGLLNLADATKPDFQRGSAKQSPNLVEFDYFPDSGFGATVSPVLVSTNNQFIPSFNFPLELTPGVRFTVAMRYTTSDQTLHTEMTRDGAAFGPIKDVTVPVTFTDFRVDTVSIASFNDAGAGGSIRARGSVDNLRVETPDPPLTRVEGALVDGLWQVTLASRTNWVYVLETSADLLSWMEAGRAKNGTGEVLRLTDEEFLESNSVAPASSSSFPSPQRFYRVRMQRR